MDDDEIRSRAVALVDRIESSVDVERALAEIARRSHRSAPHRWRRALLAGAAAAVVVVAWSLTASDGSRLTVGTDTTPTHADVVPSTGAAIAPPVTAGLTPPSVLTDGCDVPVDSYTEYALLDPIAATPAADSFEVSITAPGGPVCTNAEFEVDVRVRNMTSSPAVFNAENGLTLISGTTALSVGTFGPSTIEPGGELTFRETVSMPDARPGTYRITVPGFAPVASIVVVAAPASVACDAAAGVPDVTGLDEITARTALDTAGLRVSVDQVGTDEPDDIGRVVAQDPVPGSIVPCGSTVSVTIALIGHVVTGAG